MTSSIIRLFVSSTFEDLSLERRFLAEVVFPEFKIKANANQKEFYEIDLRWGLKTDAPIIKTCLREIELTKPYFIGIIGMSDGTIPSNADFAKEYGVFEEYNSFIESCVNDGCGITEMEIRYGIANNHDMRNVRFFWLDYLEHTTRQNKLYEDLKLKGYVIEHCESLQQLGEKVSKYLDTLLLDTEEGALKTELESFRSKNRVLVKSLTRDNVNRADINTELLYQFISSNNQIFVIHGESGVGKTNVLAKFIQEWSIYTEKQIIYHFHRTDYVDEIYSHLLLEFESIVGKTFDQIAQNEGLVNITQPKNKCLWLCKLINEEIYIALDGMDLYPQMPNDVISSFTSINKNLKFIITIDSIDINNQIEDNATAQFMVVKFPSDLLPQIVEKYYTPYKRTFPNELIPYLYYNKWNFNSLYALLNELRTFSVHRNLHTDLESYLKYSEQELYIQILGHWFDLFPYIKEKHIIDYIALSHYGITPMDLQNICGVTQTEYSFVNALLLPYIGNIGGRLFYKNKIFKNAILDIIEDGVKLRRDLESFYISKNDVPTLFDEALYQATELNDATDVVNILLNLNVFHFAYNYRLNDLFNYWAGIDGDEIEYLDFSIFLEGYEIDTLEGYIALDESDTIDVPKVYILKEVIDFIQFSLKPYAPVKWECNEVCSKIAQYIYEQLLAEPEHASFYKVELLKTCIQAFTDSYDSNRRDKCISMLSHDMETELFHYLDLYEMHFQLKKDVGDTWKNIEPDLSFDYLYNILDLPSRISTLLENWISCQVEIISTGNSARKVNATYNKVTDVLKRAKDLVGENHYYVYLATLKYSIGYFSYNHGSIEDAHTHFYESFIIRTTHVLPKDSSRYHIDRLFETYRMANSCMLHTNKFNIEELERFSVELEKYGAKLFNYKYNELIGESYLNCGAAFYNFTLDRELEEDVRRINLENAINKYSKSLHYLPENTRLEDIIKAYFFRLLCSIALDLEYEQDLIYIQENIEEIENPNSMTCQIKDILSEGGFI